MTDLTEKWRKGKLPEGWYWVKDDDGQIKLAEYSVYCIDRETNETEYDWSCLYEIEQVLAEVPDYIDWRNMVNCACEEHEANTKLLEENAELKDTIEALKAELKQVCDVLIRKCPEMKEWVMLNWKNLYEVDNAR